MYDNVLADKVHTAVNEPLTEGETTVGGRLGVEESERERKRAGGEREGYSRRECFHGGYHQ